MSAKFDNNRAKKLFDVRGVIFQISPESVIFEFAEDTDLIGVVDPMRIVLGNDNGHIPKEDAGNLDAISRYISIGDEIMCDVQETANLKKFVYTEDEEEVTESGKVINSSREVSIQPGWWAGAAVLVRGRKDGTEFERQLGDLFDQRVKNTVEAKNVNKPAVVKEKSLGSAKDKEVFNKKDAGPVRALVVQLKRPRGGREKVKVFSGLMEIKEGVHTGKRAVFVGSSIMIFGYSLARADLNYHLRAGDEFKVELTVNTDGSVTIKKGSLGPNTTPSGPKDSNLIKWLGERSLDFVAFQRWLNDGLVKKIFFPLPSKIYKGELASFAKGDVVGRVAGGVIRLTEGLIKGKTAVFDVDDFYLHSVHPGNADLRLFVRPGEVVRCMVREPSSKEKALYKRYVPSMEFDFIATLAFVGEKRPRSAALGVHESPELKTLLQKIGMTVTDFLDVITAPTVEEVKQKAIKQVQQQQSNKKPQQQPPPPLMSQNPPPPPFLPEAVSPSVTSHTLRPPFPPGTEVLNHPAVMLCVRACQLKDADDPGTRQLLVSDVDVDYAVFLAKVLTQSLLHKMQSTIRDKVLTKKPVSTLDQNHQAALVGQALQITAAQKGIKGVTYPPRPVAPPENQHAQRAKELAQMTNIGASISQKFQEVEAKLKLEIAIKKDMAKRAAGSDQSRKMKKMLQQFKASKQQEAKTDVDGKADRELTPIELLRRFHVRKLPIELDGDLICMGQICYPKNTRTNFMGTNNRPGATSDYYDLFTLYYFLQNLHRDHNEYVRVAECEGVSLVSRGDRNSLMSYLSGNRDSVPNLVNKTHKELNPHLFQESFGVTAQKRSWQGEGDSGLGSDTTKFKRRSRFDVGPEGRSPGVMNPWVNPQDLQQQQTQISVAELEKRQRLLQEEERRRMLFEEEEQRHRLIEEEQRRRILEEEERRRQRLLEEEEEKRRRLVEEKEREHRRRLELDNQPMQLLAKTSARQSRFDVPEDERFSKGGSILPEKRSLSPTRMSGRERSPLLGRGPSLENEMSREQLERERQRVDRGRGMDVLREQRIELEQNGNGSLGHWNKAEELGRLPGFSSASAEISEYGTTSGGTDRIGSAMSEVRPRDSRLSGGGYGDIGRRQRSLEREAPCAAEYGFRSHRSPGRLSPSSRGSENIQQPTKFTFSKFETSEPATSTASSSFHQRLGREYIQTGFSKFETTAGTASSSHQSLGSEPLQQQMGYASSKLDASSASSRSITNAISSMPWMKFEDSRAGSKAPYDPMQPTDDVDLAAVDPPNPTSERRGGDQARNRSPSSSRKGSSAFVAPPPPAIKDRWNPSSSQPSREAPRFSWLESKPSSSLEERVTWMPTKAKTSSSLQVPRVHQESGGDEAAELGGFSSSFSGSSSFSSTGDRGGQAGAWFGDGGKHQSQQQQGRFVQNQEGVYMQF